MESHTRGRQKFDQPCAACRLLHRKCSSDCILAPYFPADDPEKFARVHKVFGASNVIKMLQTVEEADREDAVKSLVYEAYARIRDPVYGSTGALFYLQNHVKDLSEQLAMTKAQILEYQIQKDHMVNALLGGVPQFDSVYAPVNLMAMDIDASSSLDSSITYLNEPIQFTSDCCQVI